MKFQDSVNSKILKILVQTNNRCQDSVNSKF